MQTVATSFVTQQDYREVHFLRYPTAPHSTTNVNLLAPELFFNFSTPVYKMWITQETNMLDLLNKMHFEEEKTDSIHHV